MKKQSKMLASQEFAVFCFTLAVVLAFVLLSTSFATVANFCLILSQVSINGICAIGVSMVVFLGGIDLSSGAILALCASCSGMFVNMGIPVFFCILMSIAMWSVQWCIGRKIKNSADHCHNGFHEHFSRHRDCCNERRLDHRLSKILQYIGPRQNLWYSDPILDICSHHSLLRYSDEIFQYRPENICGRRQY